MLNLMKKIFNSNEKELKKMRKVVQKINSFEAEIEKLSDEELKQKTANFKQRIQDGETLDRILPEAYAVVREGSKRVLGMRHYDVQMLGGIALHNGNISEMRTGEGKTLVSTLPTYLNALTGKGVHVITVNEYLAKRDAEEMGQLHEFLGLTVGINLNDMSPDEKRAAYACDITYGTNNEFGFDYLRDNMVLYKEEKVQRGLVFAIIDEVDSILIDEARTPLIISGKADKPVELYHHANTAVKALKKEEHYTFDERGRTASLTEEGIEKIEKTFGIENLFDIEHVKLNHHINMALRAHVVMKNDRDYVVHDGEIIIIDQFTGRMMAGRRFSEGLHQAIEAKERVEIQNESMTLATVTFQNYFRMYEKLAGMTGTAKTEESEFKEIYRMQVIVVPTNKPVARIDQADVVYKTEEAKFEALIEEIKESYEKKQPVLVGTVSIETSEYLSEKLKKKGIQHHVLNAKHHEREAEIIAGAGQKGAVTIATNMAGRGTDIKLEEGVQELGGLKVIGTERHESRRIDNQLRGRSGRQGDPGISIFYLSLEDELMRRFGGDNLKQMMSRFGIEDNEAIESKMVTRAIESAQKRVEGNNFDSRKWVLKYDDVLREQREIIYKQRDEVLESDNVKDMIYGMMKSVINQIIGRYAAETDLTEEWNFEELIQELTARIFDYSEISKEELSGKEPEEIIELLIEKAKTKHEEKENMFGDDIREFEKVITLRAIDSNWTDHIDAMEQLRQGIHLRGYGQTDPLREYQFEGFQMFERMMQSIEEEVTLFIMKTEIIQEQKREKVAEEIKEPSKKPRVSLKVKKKKK